MVKLTEKEVDERLARDFPNIVRIGKYEGALNPMKVRCVPCGHKWSPVPYSIFKGQGCPKCAVIAQTLTEKEVVERLARDFPDIILVGEYKNTFTKTEFRHKICGYEWKTKPNDIFSGKGCPKCGGTMKLTEKEVDERLARDFPDIVRIGHYKTNKVPMLVRCVPCGHKWSPTPNSVFSGHGCPKCKESRGEKEASRVLDLLKIETITEHSFDGCRNPKTNRPLFFDFYLPKLNICIEFDGYQHFKPAYWRYKTKKQAEIHFKRQQYRDKFKTKFCKSKRIKLIRIPYWEIDNIESILRRETSCKKYKNGVKN